MKVDSTEYSRYNFSQPIDSEDVLRYDRLRYPRIYDISFEDIWTIQYLKTNKKKDTG